MSHRKRRLQSDSVVGAAASTRGRNSASYLEEAHLVQAVGVGVHDGCVKIDKDLRTSGASGRRGMLNRMNLSGSEEMLLDALDLNEKVRKLISVGEPVGVFAITDARVIHLGTGGANRTITSLSRPISAEVADRNRLGLARVNLVGARGEKLDRVMLSEADMAAMSARVTKAAPPSSSSSPDPKPPAEPAEPAEQESPSAKDWSWHKTPTSWEEAGQLAADHMRHIGLQGVVVTPSRKDGGIDVISQGAAAQVKFHATPSGAPDIQALIGAALDFPSKLFYATEYTADAKAVAESRGVALFKMEPFGGVSPANLPALNLAPPPAPRARKWYEGQTLEEQVNRCLRWSDQITQYTQTAKISNSDRRARKQLEQRRAAMVSVSQAMDKLAMLDNPTYKASRRQRLVIEAESLLKGAARSLGILLK
ncbi:MAG: hypothetical protein EOL89_06075 [Actinobacteria bacterium]|nr:hypothetical protein [Actinomycetota bacterium]